MSYSYREGRKDVRTFWSAGNFIFNAQSFFTKVPSTEFIQLLLPSDLICFSLESVLKLFENFPEAQYIHRSLSNDYIEKLRAQVYEVRNASLAERYEMLLQRFIGIEQMVSQEHIASYLGVTPQSLSRVKKRISGRS